MPYIGTVLPLRLHFHSIAVTISSTALSVAAFFPTAPKTWLWSVAQSITSREGNYVFRSLDGKADTRTWITYLSRGFVKSVCFLSAKQHVMSDMIVFKKCLQADTDQVPLHRMWKNSKPKFREVKGGTTQRFTVKNLRVYVGYTSLQR